VLGRLGEMGYKVVDTDYGFTEEVDVGAGPEWLWREDCIQEWSPRFSTIYRHSRAYLFRRRL